jgi:hypothetical protein
MSASLGKLNQGAALITPSPSRFLAYFQHGIQLPIIWTVLANKMRIPLTHNTHVRPAFAAHDLKRVLRIEFGAWWDELATGWVRAKDACLPWSTKLENRFQECGLLLAREYYFDDRTWDRFRAASWWHLRFFGYGLVDHDT